MLLKPQNLHGFEFLLGIVLCSAITVLAGMADCMAMLQHGIVWVVQLLLYELSIFVHCTKIAAYAKLAIFTDSLLSRLSAQNNLFLQSTGEGTITM